MDPSLQRRVGVGGGINRQTASLILALLKSCLSQTEIAIPQVPACHRSPTVPRRLIWLIALIKRQPRLENTRLGSGELAATFTD